MRWQTENWNNYNLKSIGKSGSYALAEVSCLSLPLQYIKYRHSHYQTTGKQFAVMDSKQLRTRFVREIVELTLSDETAIQMTGETDGVPIAQRPGRERLQVHDFDTQANELSLAATTFVCYTEASKRRETMTSTKVLDLAGYYILHQPLRPR